MEGLKAVLRGETALEEALETYQEELRRRCRPAVLASRQACLDAHQWESMSDEGSPLLSRGLFKMSEEEAEKASLERF